MLDLPRSLFVREQHPTQKPEGLIERMVLASSDAGDLVLDPFCGSGSTLRVCQQLDRRATGIEINPAYVKMTEQRLATGFKGFDSLDPRMKRIPHNLRRTDVRQAYLDNHRTWFLSHHENAIETFEKAVENEYGEAKNHQHR